jgi:hypothetical protein
MTYIYPARIALSCCDATHLMHERMAFGTGLPTEATAQPGQLERIEDAQSAADRDARDRRVAVNGRLPVLLATIIR